MQTAVETDENAPLRAFVVAVQEGFMLEHMEVIPNKPAENSTFSIVMFAVDHFTRYNSLQGEATSETIQEYVTWVRSARMMSLLSMSSPPLLRSGHARSIRL